MGKTLFESADYALRNRSNHDYVYDLYETYLLRSPDSGGWAFWEGLVPSIGRENVRRAFDESGEFAYDVSTVTSGGGPSTAVSSLLSARADANNQSGNQVMTRDAEWSVSLLSLPGRAGLDLGLGLSYSSAASWTRSGPYIYFDDDNSSLSPGFRLGFPTVQELYFDAQVGQSSYLLITAAGSRVELRQVGTSSVYEAGDSSYLQLTDNGSSLLLRSTDGTQMSYTKFENEWQCTQIKDRNGNYITVNHNSFGDITTVIDTLGRTITFNYDGNANLATITQSWNGQPHTWATFHLDPVTIQPNFSGVSVSGIANGQSVPMLTMVGLADGSYYKFSYTNWNSGELARVTLYASDSNPASDNHELNHRAFTYIASDDSTRLTDTRVAAENWTGINGVPSEVVTQFGFDGGSAYWVNSPDGTIYKQFYGTSWQKRLPAQTETWSGGVKQKWTAITWTQDNTNVGYQLNPRTTETNVFDSNSNHSRTTIDYTTPFTLPEGVSCVLPSDIYEYAADGNVLRRTHTDYNLSSTYVSANRRIIGLPAAKYVCNGTQGAVPCNDSSGASLFSKTTLQYDESGSIQNQGSPVQHDDTDFGYGFLQGRANVSSTRHYDVNNLTQYTATSGLYNSEGSLISMTDPLGHQSTVGYTDSFSSDGANSTNPSFVTLGYPTTITDAGGNSFSIKYHYDFGARIRVQGPPPANQSQGLIQTFSYDNAARIQQVTTNNNSGYKRYVYGPNYAQNYMSVNNVADEAYAIKTFDGLGRVIGAARNHPGSTGGYKAQLAVYDQMGQSVKQSNLTEINGSWVPAGEENPNSGIVSSMFGTDNSWKQTRTYSSGWQNTAFNDNNWSAAVDEGAYGASPWGSTPTFPAGTPAHWIWYNYSPGTNDYSTVYFRKSFVATSYSATLTLRADDGYTAYLNGNQVATGSGWNQSQTVTLSLTPGATYVLAISATNTGGPGGLVANVSNTGGWGWVYSTQSYDWNGRPLLTTHPDGTQKSASYGGCGCAGGEVVTLTDEVGQQQRATSDILGRRWKTEILNSNGSTYSLTKNAFNVNDQVTQVREFQGDDTSGVYQDTIIGYDGYGRLQSKHSPEQNANTSTTYSYNPDDTVYSVTDARGATATYGYNNRHMVTGISYSAPSGITVPAAVSYGYDAAGNRTSMTDGLGSKTYAYDQLSQLTSETRTLTNVGNFTLGYAYNLVGELKKITDATNSAINYSFDNAGRVTGVTGSDTLYGGVSNYASNLKYRAWDDLKEITDGSSHTSALGYNLRLQVSHFDLSGGAVVQNYDYRNDGRLKFVHNATDFNFDRSYTYDQSGRLIEAKTGGQARGDYGSNPYHESFDYDVWSNLTSRATDMWDDYSSTDSGGYTNNRRGDWAYDADGRNTTIDTRNYSYDAAGQSIQMTGQKWVFNHYTNVTQTSGFDGDGQRVKDVSDSVTTYYLRSTALGDTVVEEINSSGQKVAGYVYSPGGQLLAQQANSIVTFKHSTPAGTGKYDTYSSSGSYGRVELDPVGADVALAGAPTPDTGGGDGDVGSSHFGGLMSALYGDIFNLSGGCMIDGMAASCGLAMSMVNMGAAAVGPENTTRWNPNADNGKGGFEFFHAFADGLQGWGPLGAVSDGKGGFSTGNNGSKPPTLKREGPKPNPKPGDRDPYNLLTEGYQPETTESLQPPHQYDAKVVLKAVDDAIKMSDPKKHKGCDQALNKLSGGKIPSLNALISKYKDAAGNLANISDGHTTQAGSHGVDAKDIPAFVLGAGTATAHTYINTAFFSDVAAGAGSARAIIMIHEAVHQFGGLDDTDFDPNNHNQTVGSKAITKAIIDKCFPALRTLGSQLANI